MNEIDRRVQKTKKILSESLIALILEKGYEQITIQEIIDKANVGRSTFYTHYENKEQLLLAGPKNLGVALFSQAKESPARGGKPTLDFLPLFRHASQNLPLAKAMLGKKSGMIFNSHLQSHLCESLIDQFKPFFGKTKREKQWLKYLGLASASLVTTFLIAWLEEDRPFTEEEIAEQCRLAVRGVFESWASAAINKAGGKS